MTIDAYVDENNEDLEGHNDDSCWNFHVWNEIFITGKGHWPANYAGWAAIDSTPQVCFYAYSNQPQRQVCIKGR